MRNIVTRSASIALALALIAMLTPMGVSEAKGGKAVSWQVAIPVSLDGRNLAGFSPMSSNGYAIFQDQGFRGSVLVGFSAGRTSSAFTLLFRPGTADYGVKMGGIDLADAQIQIPGDPFCRLGDHGSTAPECMELFLQDADGHPQPMYDFSLQVATDEDVETQTLAGGRLFLDMWDAYDQAGEDHQYHRLSCSTERKAVTIQRTGSVWTISSGASSDADRLTCEEYYLEPAVGTGKGNSGQVKTVKRTVMTAKTVDPFVFETIWTRN